MQATDCRRAFPCWDEPELKAVFGVTLVVARGPAGDLQRARGRPRAGAGAARCASGSPTPCRCRPTWWPSWSVRSRPPTPVDVDGVPLRGRARARARATSPPSPLEIGAFALRWFQDYYGIPYPGDKVDLVALPDFAAGAMENLGCITFREDALLVDPATATQQEEQRVADVVAHELAHMWFGDLVTMRWWNGIWLNEAFATFMEIAALRRLPPRRGSGGRTSASSARRPSRPTPSPATRPVEFEVVSPDRRRGHVRRAHLREGRRAAAHAASSTSARSASATASATTSPQHSYANTETTDLWDALERTSARAGAPHHGLAGSGRAATRWSAPAWPTTAARSCWRSAASASTAPTTGPTPPVGRAGSVRQLRTASRDQGGLACSSTATTPT